MVVMIPKDENVRSMLAVLEIHLQPDLSATREVVMREPGGDLTRIIFNREKRGVKFPDGTFDQSKPLDVIEIKKIAVTAYASIMSYLLKICRHAYLSRPP